MRVSVELLERYWACDTQIELFKKFLDGRKYVLTTQRNIKLAIEFGLDVIWIARITEGEFHFISKRGDAYWYQDGKLHRIDGPAVEYAKGDKFWYQHGELHRLDGPAVEYSNGYKFWYQNSILYRDDDGPVVETPAKN